ncbi:MAG: hypothetical protein LAT62_15355 [Natronospirillum sp.]|uniref:Wzz/FepE/Etk N-terminal domain-containing protein n=1 Tax=Natronospirillum sp. TaxID=2812955 RepID=UPI0025F85CE3|nr:Wzz/FepE/Etk N-terminal domain-containing protein [Natronospirillum sp.]MCH8553315.1 hypothetical protein [Natronospirillum sp.]
MTDQKPKYPTQQPPEHYPYPQYRDDEISLVDLAKILIRRRWWVIGTGFVIVAAAFAYALLNRAEPNYQMVTLYEVAQYQNMEGETRALQPVNTLIRRVENIHWPAYMRAFLEDNSEYSTMPFELRLENPSNTLLISMRSTAPRAEQEKIEGMHREILGHIEATQTSAYERRHNLLNSQIDRIQTNLEQAGNGLTTLPPELVASYSDRLMDLEATLETLVEGEVIQYAARGERSGRSGPGGSLILALGIVLGGILGLLAGFFAEFAYRVRQSILDDGGI